MRILPLLVLFLLLAAPGVAQSVEDRAESEEPYEFESEIDTLCFNGVCLDPVEMEVYRSAEDEIERRLPHAGEPSGLLPVVEELLFRIDELPLEERPRHSLQSLVGDLAMEDEPLGGATFYALLGSPDPDIQYFALGRLFAESDHDWLDDEALVGSLLELLDDPRADRDLRDAVLWIFSQAEAFEIVAERARRLASDSSDLDLAYGAAQVIVNEVAYQPKEMERLYRSSRGPVRQVAAMSLARGPTEEPLANEIVVDLRGVAIDHDLPPWVRGEAIEALGGLAKRARGRAILFELLEPEHWFFGARGAHFQVHSLAKVISALWRVAEHPEVREKLNALYPVLERLRSGEREYVEWELDLVLGKDPGNFYGPVDPERRP